MAYPDFSKGSTCWAAGLLALVFARPGITEAQDMAQCKVSYKTIQQSDIQIQDLQLALDRQYDRTVVETATSIINRLQATYSDLRRGSSPSYLQSVEDRKKFADNAHIDWDTRWTNDREAFLRAMVQDEQQLMKKSQAEADALTAKIKNEPGTAEFRELDSRLRTAKASKTEAEKNFESLGCDKQAVAAAVAQEDQQNAPKDAFLKQLMDLEQKAKAANVTGRIAANLSDAKKQLFEATNAAAGAAEKLGYLQQSLRSLSGASRACADAAERHREIEAYAKSAQQEENLLVNLIDQASGIKCSDANAAANIRQKYNQSIQQFARIGADLKQAQAANQQIERILQASGGPQRDRLLQDAQNYAADIDARAQKAKAAANEVSTLEDRANQTAAQSQIDFRDLDQKYVNLYLTYTELYPINVSAAPVRQRMAQLETALGNGKVQTIPTAEFEDLKTQAMHRADAAAQNAADAKSALGGIQSALKGCDTKSANDLVDQISSRLTSAEIEVGAGADLRQKAQACEQPDAGTDKQIRDAAAVIHSLADQCRFQDALNFANNIPERYRSLTLIQNEMARARIGAQAVANVQQALKQSQAAAQRGDRAQADQFLKQAQWEANNDQRWYHCAAPLLQAAPGLPSPPSAAGGLVLTKTEILPAHDDVGGVGNLRSHYSNSSTTADILRTETTSDGKLLQQIQTHFEYAMKFSGTSGVLRPGDTITVTIYGTDARTPMNTGGAWGVTGAVHQSGLQQVSGKPCWVGAGFNDGYHPTCSGEFVFQVTPSHDQVSLSFVGNFGIGDAVTYTWEKPR